MPDEFLTVDEAAQRLALPPEMIRRRIESGDIPVHWVEVDGKLEMRVASEDVGGLGSAGPTFQDQYNPPSSYSPPREERSDTEPGTDPDTWNAGEDEYAPSLWTPVQDPQAEPSNPWELNQADELDAPEVGPATVPVWRPDPATWEDEPLEATPGTTVQEYAPLPGPYLQTGPEQPEEDDEKEPGFSPQEPAGPGFPSQPSGLFSEPEPQEEFSEPAASDYGFESAPAPYTEPEEGTFSPSSYESEIEIDEVEVEEELGVPAPPSPDELTPPSALAASQLAGPGSVALNSIDARELVAGLFERWERALEQRIQAEQRLRFEAELEQRLRQVRDLRQELDQTRKTQAAQMAEREREMTELRNKVRELERAPKSRRLFRR